MARTDWDKIKAAYLRGGISYRDLAARYRVSESTLTKRAIRGSWADERQQIGSTVAAELPTVVAAAMSKDLAAYLGDGIAALDVAMGITLERIQGGVLEFKSMGEAIASLTKVTKTQADLAVLAAQGDAGRNILALPVLRETLNTPLAC